MACDNDPNHPPPAKRSASPDRSATTIDSLGDDIILEIFLRLPCFTALVRAAFTRRAWRRAVASSPSFRRRFRELHRAPFLGVFFSPVNDDDARDVLVFPPFAPSRCPDRDLAGVIRSGDFFLTSIPVSPGAAPSWDMVDCRGGFVLLGDWTAESYAVLNPSTRKVHGFFDIPWDILVHHCGYHPILHDTHLICSDEDPMSFRVICLVHDDSFMMRVAVFSSATREWSVLPWVEASPRPHCEGFCFERGVEESESDCKYFCIEKGTQDSGLFIYWPFKSRKSFIMLDTSTMELSVAQLPLHLKNRDHIHSFVIGDTEDGLPCIVYAAKFNIGVLLRNADDGYERWVLDRLHSLKEQVGRVLRALPDYISGLNVTAIRNGYVYLKTVGLHDNPQAPCWFFSLCLETMELGKVLKTIYDSDMHPYNMPWPPCLVGDYGRFADEAAPGSTKCPGAVET
ncbi:hypothetical protein EJB05_53541, partial [Eragrostis curvula]